MTLKKPCKHIYDLARELGPEYSVTVIDRENCIYRNFHNGFDVEISGADHNSERKRVTIYLWGQKFGFGILKVIENVPQGNIGDRVEELKFLTSRLISEEITTHTALEEYANIHPELDLRV